MLVNDYFKRVQTDSLIIFVHFLLTNFRDQIFHVVRKVFQNSKAALKNHQTAQRTLFIVELQRLQTFKPSGIWF